MFVACLNVYLLFLSDFAVVWLMLFACVMFICAWLFDMEFVATKRPTLNVIVSLNLNVYCHTTTYPYSLAGYGVWPWGSRVKFFRFPEKKDQLNSDGNSAANTQLLIETIDGMRKKDEVANN